MSLKEKQFVGQRQKLLFEMESELAEELFQKLSGEPLNRFPPPGFLEQRGVVTCRNAPCLKLGVRQRKRSFSQNQRSVVRIDANRDAS